MVCNNQIFCRVERSPNDTCVLLSKFERSVEKPRRRVDCWIQAENIDPGVEGELFVFGQGGEDEQLYLLGEGAGEKIVSQIENNKTAEIKHK